jgi:heme exporter protein D
MKSLLASVAIVVLVAGCSTAPVQYTQQDSIKEGKQALQRVQEDRERAEMLKRANEQAYRSK